MTLSGKLSTLPAVRHEPGARNSLNASLRDSNTRFVVIDDGLSAGLMLHGIHIYMRWSKDVLERALNVGDTVVYICIPTSGMHTEDARESGCELGRNLAQIAVDGGLTLLLAYIGDGTLRTGWSLFGEAVLKGAGIVPHGIVLAPAFFEAGRYTIDGFQWQERDGQLERICEVGRGRVADPAGRTGGEACRAGTSPRVRSVSLETIRKSGRPAVLKELMSASGGAAIVFDAVCREDLDVACLALMEAEKRGKRFFYLGSAALLRSRAGLGQPPLLSRAELKRGPGAGLVVLDGAAAASPEIMSEMCAADWICGIRLRPPKLETEPSRGNEVESICKAAGDELARGFTVVLYCDQPYSGEGSGSDTTRALCDIVSGLRTPPRFFGGRAAARPWRWRNRPWVPRKPTRPESSPMVSSCGDWTAGSPGAMCHLSCCRDLAATACRTCARCWEISAATLLQCKELLHDRFIRRRKIE